MKVGRPLKTEIREKIAFILMNIGQSYGYEIYKHYKTIFGEVTLRNLYYNIKKGVELGEFIVIDIKRESGEFTWGEESQHVYYTIGPYARTFSSAALTLRQQEQVQVLPKREAAIDWEKEVNLKIEQMKIAIQNFLKNESSMVYDDKVHFRNLIKSRAENLKEWMKSRFEKDKAHELHVRIDEAIKIIHSGQ